MQLPAVLLQYNLFAWLYQVQLAACYFKNMQFFICKNKLPKNPWKSQTKFSFYSYTSPFTTWQFYCSSWMILTIQQERKWQNNTLHYLIVTIKKENKRNIRLSIHSFIPALKIIFIPGKSINQELVLLGIGSHCLIHSLIKENSTHDILHIQSFIYLLNYPQNVDMVNWEAFILGLFQIYKMYFCFTFNAC